MKVKDAATMTHTWKPIVLCLAEDLSTLTPIDPIARLVTVEVQGKTCVYAAIGDPADPIPQDVLYRDTLGFAVTSPKAHSVHQDVASDWSNRFGAPSGPDLIHCDGQDTVANIFARHCMHKMSLMHQRNADLMRELTNLRLSHDATQGAFQSLEAMFYDHTLADRTVAFSLAPHLQKPGVVLTNGTELQQRLPGSSTGLCDVSIYISRPPGAVDGRLHATLRLVDSNQTAGSWSVSANDLARGWLRFSLDRALGTDAQTLELHVMYDGETELELSTSFAHPDPRFRPAPDAPLLALETYTYVPGSHAPFPANGVRQVNAAQKQHVTIGLDELRNAQHMTPKSGEVAFSPDLGGLLVKPTNKTANIARLNTRVPAGTVHLSGGVKVHGDTGPWVEFAYALAPSQSDQSQEPDIPSFSEGCTSEWLRVPPGHWTRLHVFLPAPLTSPHDLYLMTRLADTHRARQQPAACFYRITAQLDPAMSR